MANYKLSKAAELDLIRIHQYGVINFGELQADKYYFAFFEKFEKIAKQPHLFQTVYDIRKGYRRCVLGADSIYYRILNSSIEITRIIGRQDFEL
jgi:toxin ParE1/3/4